MRRRVVVWGPGGVGSIALRHVLTSPAFELVGVRCYAPEKEGCDAGELAGVPTCGVRATADVDALLALDADCVLFCPRSRLSDPTVADSPERAWVDELLQILRSGTNVVSSIGSGVHWRHLENGVAWKAELDAACTAGGSTILFTGRNPGFSTDCLPVVLGSLSREIDRIRVWELVDLSHYAGVDALRRMGLGGEPGDPARSSGVIRVTWGGSVYVMADACGVAIDELIVTGEQYVSARSFTGANGLTVEAGCVGAIMSTLTGLVRGAPRLQVSHVHRMAADMLPDQPSLGERSGCRVEIDGCPPVRVDLPIDETDDAMAMTAARIVNCIDAVVDAGPGYVTANDLSLLGPRWALRP